MAFTIRKIEHAGSTCGEKLKALRKERGKAIAEVAQSTRLHTNIIRAFEKDQYGKLPESIYARQFLKTYVDHLQGNTEYFLDCFDQERGTCDNLNAMRLPRERVRKSFFLVTPRIFRLTAISLGVIAVFTYLGFEVRNILVPPSIELVSPENGSVTDSAVIPVTGKTMESSEVYVNGELVLIENDGSFTTSVNLQKGLNTITVEAKKRYSQKARATRHIILEDVINTSHISAIEHDTLHN